MVSEERTQEIHENIFQAVVEFDTELCVKWCKIAIDEGLDAYETIMGGLAAGMDRVGELYTTKEYFVPELLMCSDALYGGLEVLRPLLKLESAGTRGRVLLGVIEGDIHDIGKNLVKTMFEAAGWDVLDLGRDVKMSRFVEELKRNDHDVLAVSALMTTSMLAMPKLIEMVKAEKRSVKILVGGAPMSREIANKYGADGYAPDAVAAVHEAAALLTKGEGTL
ncbi:MAG: corrinoid protein [Deltaproteobacteria bacterium]|nr:corrinoid protein [Deltaproteobacteria bacterium]